MAVAYGEIARVLDGARRRQFRIVIATAAGAGGAAALACVLAGALAVVGGARLAVARPVALAGAGVAVLGAIAWAVRAVRRTSWTDEAAARTVAGAEAALRSDLVSAVELERDRPDIAATGRFSVALVDAHVERTAARAAGIDLARALPDAPARRGGAAALAAVAAWVVALAVGGAGVVRAAGQVLAGPPPGAPRTIVDPITGDVKITYVYPAYMRRQTATLSGTAGEVRAPKGTEVRLETRADRKVERAEIEIEDGASLDSARQSRATLGMSGGGNASAPSPRPGEPGAPSPRPGEPGTSSPRPREPGTPSPRPSPPLRGGEGAGSPVGEGEGAGDSSKFAHPEHRAEGPNTPAHPEPFDSGTSALRSGSTESRDATRGPHVFAITVKDRRDLDARFVVQDGGSYRFRFLDARGRVVAEGPPIPIVVEPDAFPEVRITAPAGEIEVGAGATVRVEWQASDDWGLGDLTLVTKAEGGEEKRQPLRSFGGDTRREAGAFDLPIGPAQLGEGDRLLYWLEVTDDDAVSGPKKSASATQVVKIYSEAEHRRALLEKAQAVWEEMVGLLGDRLETFAKGPVATPERLPLAEALDARARALHERMREVAKEIRKDRAAPPGLAPALVNLSGELRLAEQRVTAVRQTIARAFRVRFKPDPGTLRQAVAFDAQLDDRLERGILYLEQLLDKTRADDVVRLAKDLARSRRDLAGLLERYRNAPSDAARKEVLAQIRRMKARMQELMSRIAELSKGFNDEHMNAEALAELERSKDLSGGLDQVEKLLAKGDVEGAMKALDRLGASMDQMLSSFQRNAGVPDEQAQALMKEMLAFKKDLEDVQSEQRRTAEETERIRQAYRKRVKERLKDAEATAKRLAALAREARHDVEQAQPGVSTRAEPDYDGSRESLDALERALRLPDFDAALESVQRALPPMQRLEMSLEEDAEMADRYGEVLHKDPRVTRDAQRHAQAALPKALQIRDELSKLFPDARQALSREDQRKLEQLAKRQGQLERRAGELQQKLGELAQKAPVFPPSAQGQLGESRGHMGQAAGELAQRNPQRGHGQQELAMDALERFRKGLEDAAKQGGAGGGGGFPFPFAESGSGDSGEGAEPSQEKVQIPGADAYKAPAEFRKDLLDAMRQGAPEKYKGEVKRYYEELVK